MKYLLMIVLMFSFGQASAEKSEKSQYYLGSEILEYCEAYLREEAGGNICFGFVVGISDAHSTLWCSPADVDPTQMIRIVTKYSQEHPEDVRLPAGSLVANALFTAFPCE